MTRINQNGGSDERCPGSLCYSHDAGNTISKLLGQYKCLSEENQLAQVLDLCHEIGSLNAQNVIGRFEKEIQAQIADLDDEDELMFDTDLF